MAKSLDNLSLEELTTLNEEIVMLSRSGVALEAGLLRFAKDGRGAANQVAERLGKRLESGKSLTDSIRDEGGRFPEVYATVVESGVRAGRLPSALEAISEFSREFTELRRGLLQAVIYPLLTIVAAYVMFILFISHAVKQIAQHRETFGYSTGAFLGGLVWLAENTLYWAWIPPLLLFLGVLAWSGSGRAGAFSLSGINSLVMLLPGMSRVVRYFRHSMFARMAGVLLEQNVPLSDSLLLAASGCGKQLQRAALGFADADRNGDRSAVDDSSVRGMQPLLRWMLKREQSGDQLVTNLKLASRSYYEKGEVTLRWIRTVAPIVFTLFIGGTLTILYTLSLFVPLTDLLRAIAEETV